MNNELQTLRLFSPLFPHIYPYNDWGDLENDPVDMDAGELLQYTEEIQALIQKAQLPCENKHGLAIYTWIYLSAMWIHEAQVYKRDRLHKADVIFSFERGYRFSDMEGFSS